MDSTQFELPPPDLGVWEKTLLPTTSSRITRLPNGSLARTFSVRRCLEDGDMESLEKSLNEIQRLQTESLSSQWEEYLSSLQTTQTSSLGTPSQSSTSVSTEQLQKLEPVSAETPDESTSVEWLQTQLTSDTSRTETGSGNSNRVTSWIVSTIKRVGSSLRGSGK